MSENRVRAQGMGSKWDLGESRQAIHRVLLQGPRDENLTAGHTRTMTGRVYQSTGGKTGGKVPQRRIGGSSSSSRSSRRSRWGRYSRIILERFLVAM